MTSRQMELDRALALAVAAFNGGRMDLAASMCKYLLQSDMTNAPAHQLLAVVYLGQRQSAAAYHHICCSLQQRPGHAPSLKIAMQVARANLEFGLALQQAGHWDDACASLERSISRAGRCLAHAGSGTARSARMARGRPGLWSGAGAAARQCGGGG